MKPTTHLFFFFSKLRRFLGYFRLWDYKQANTMKTLPLYICLMMLSLILTSCEEGEDIPLTKLEGTYVGSFQRIVGNEPGPVSQVTLAFGSTTWEGQSDTPKYPALCKGSYEVRGSRIIFDNSCFFTADFDWSLILKGEFEIKHTGNSVTFTKVHPGSTTQIIDVYTLQVADVTNL